MHLLDFNSYLFINFSSNYVFFSIFKIFSSFPSISGYLPFSLLFFPFTLRLTVIWLSRFPWPSFASKTSVKYLDHLSLLLYLHRSSHFGGIFFIILSFCISFSFILSFWAKLFVLMLPKCFHLIIKKMLVYLILSKLRTYCWKSKYQMNMCIYRSFSYGSFQIRY